MNCHIKTFQAIFKNHCYVNLFQRLLAFKQRKRVVFIWIYFKPRKKVFQQVIPVLFTNRCSIVDLKGGLPGRIFKACSNRKYQYGPYYMSVNELYKVLKKWFIRNFDSYDKCGELWWIRDALLVPGQM